MQDSFKVENTPTHHHREYNVSGTTQASFLAKFKATQNKLGQKRHHHSVYMIYIIYVIYKYTDIYTYPQTCVSPFPGLSDYHIYVYIYIYIYIYRYIYRYIDI